MSDTSYVIRYEPGRGHLTKYYAGISGGQRGWYYHQTPAVKRYRTRAGAERAAKRMFGDHSGIDVVEYKGAA